MESKFSPLSAEEESIGNKIIKSAFQVHSHLGPGLLEKIYETCLAFELRKQGLVVSRQVNIPIRYKDLEFDEGIRLDLLVGNKVIVEIKAIETVNPVWEAQFLSQLRLMDLHLGYLLNFHVPLMKQGIKRFR